MCIIEECNLHILLACVGFLIDDYEILWNDSQNENYYFYNENTFLPCSV